MFYMCSAEFGCRDRFMHTGFAFLTTSRIVLFARQLNLKYLAEIKAIDHSHFRSCGIQILSFPQRPLAIIS